MVDFSSVLYLGLRHPSALLRPWPSLTRGAPAALRPSPEAGELAERLAALVGCARGLLMTSTLHLFWDLFGAIALEPVAIYVDAAAYPIARWGVERAMLRGVPVRGFAHFEPAALGSCLGRERRRPVVVTDGFCTGCGRPAPLAAYVELIRRRGGLLILDDTQALGVLGAVPGRSAPYGRGGGGMLRFAGVGGPEIVWAASLAKGFGVPMAAVAGSDEMIEWLQRESETRIHCSPPSAAALNAARRALEVNAADGERRRGRLLSRVRRFRDGLRARSGMVARGGLFPVQSIELPSSAQVLWARRRLRSAGIETVARRGCGGAPQLCFSLTADHRDEEIDRALDELLALFSTDAITREDV